MRIFPRRTYSFTLVDEADETIERLKRRTYLSESLGSQKTDKSFIGTINNSNFKIISAETGHGALCVLAGKIEDDGGEVHIELNKVFKYLFMVLYIFPVVAFIATYLENPQQFSFYLIILVPLQILMIRFFFIEIFFRAFSKRSLLRFRDVLDAKTMKKK